MQRVIGIVRVSEVGDRDGDSFASPDQQRERIETATEAQGNQLVDVHEELDVSGARPLSKRPGLLAAVEAVEAGEADVIVAAYFDRLFRSLSTQAEAVQRVEAAGGSIAALDVGAISNGSAANWLSGTMLGAMSEYTSRTSRERSAANVYKRIMQGVLPFKDTPLGIVRGDDGKAHVDAEHVELVRDAFALRASGASYQAVRELLAERGVERSYRSVQIMLKSALYVGELRVGGRKSPEIVNLNAVEPIVDRAVWDRVQALRGKAGATTPSDRLLARLDLLRCGSCGRRMVAGGQVARWGETTRRYAFYKCPSAGHECSAPVTIAADKVEEYVVAELLARIEDAEETVASGEAADAATTAARAAKEAYGQACRNLARHSDSEMAQEVLDELRAELDEAERIAKQLNSTDAAEIVNAARDWYGGDGREPLSSTTRRRILRAGIRSVTVSRGRAAVADRVAIGWDGLLA